MLDHKSPAKPGLDSKSAAEAICCITSAQPRLILVPGVQTNLLPEAVEGGCMVGALLAGVHVDVIPDRSCRVDSHNSAQAQAPLRDDLLHSRTLGQAVQA